VSTLSIAHTACGVSCLVLGAFVFFNGKATRLHRTAGTLYALGMIALNVSALCIYHLTGRFNLFHLFAVLSLLMVFIGWSQVVFRRHFQRWFYRHYTYMCWSYAGLIAATSNEGFVRVPGLKALVQGTGNWLILATQVAILGICAILLSRNKTRLHKNYARASIN